MVAWKSDHVRKTRLLDVNTGPSEPLFGVFGSHNVISLLIEKKNF